MASTFKAVISLIQIILCAVGIIPVSTDISYGGTPYEPLQYLLIDGEFHGASVGHFRNGPYDLNDVVCDLQDYPHERLAAAIRSANFGKSPARINGVPYKEEEA